MIAIWLFITVKIIVKEANLFTKHFGDGIYKKFIKILCHIAPLKIIHNLFHYHLSMIKIIDYGTITYDL